MVNEDINNETQSTPLPHEEDLEVNPTEENLSEENPTSPSEEQTPPEENPKCVRFRKDISVRYFSIVALMVVAFLSVIIKAAFLMFACRDYWEQVAARFVKEDIVKKPNRGNILSADGQLMASSLPEYKIFMDFMTSESKKFPERRKADQDRRDTLLDNNIDEICQGLHAIFPDMSEEQFKAHILKGKTKKSRNWPIYPKRISYIQYKEVKKLPVFRLSQYRGGFIGMPFYRRKKPFGSLAMRTLGDTFIGYPDSAKNGLELAYDSILSGENGLIHRQKVQNKYLDIVDKAPVDGADIVTTIDVNMQDIAEKALVDKLYELNASMGVALLMEVKTGEVKAIVNMTRAADGKYYEMQNHAVSALMEPGSTFKTASMLVTLDDGAVDTSTVVDTGCGIYNMHGSKMKDHNWYRGGYQQLTATEVMMVSSNIGVSRLIDEYYGKQPEKFVDGLYRIGMAADLELPFAGSATPRIKRPSSKYWSKTTLAWMSIGYETQIPPINTLTFYNAIANDGVMVKPKFVKAIMRGGEVVEEIPTEVINPSICSETALKKMQYMLESVVSRGLGKKAGSKQFSVAGKTGTAQVSQGAGGYKSGPMQYLVSFCGYFPADNPRYSCLVAIRKPGYPASGGGMAGPVFSRIAERVMAGSLKRNLAEAVDSNTVIIPDVKNGDLGEARYVLSALDVDTEWEGEYRKTGAFGKAEHATEGIRLTNVETDGERIPDVRGMGAKDAVFLMESRGLRVALSGIGKVHSQSIPAGSRAVKGQTIALKMR